MKSIQETQATISKLVVANAAHCCHMGDWDRLHNVVEAAFWRSVAEVMAYRTEPSEEPVEPAPVRWQAKRQAVLTILADDNLKHETNRSIADRARVSPTFVAKVRREVEAGEKQATVASSGTA